MAMRLSAIVLHIRERKLWTDIDLIGCIYPEEMFNGVNALRARKPASTCPPDLSKRPNISLMNYYNEINVTIAKMRGDPNYWENRNPLYHGKSDYL